jgi:hypothetical protein
MPPIKRAAANDYTPDETNDQDHNPMSLHMADLHYYYRVDSHVGLRAICGDYLFRPARWLHNGGGWPHAALIAAATGMPASEAIYRISFWLNEQKARDDHACRGTQKPHVMLRVPRAVVADALDGWTFGADDYLQEAALIWRRMAQAGEKFCESGVPLDLFEVWENCGWLPWPHAQAAQPDGVRLARAGWQPLALRTQHGAVIAYWRMVLHRPEGAHPEPWCVLTLDERSPGTLSRETAAVQQAVDLLLAGPLCTMAGFLAGLLTVYVAQDRLWTEQYSVVPRAPKPHSRFKQLLRMCSPERPPWTWDVEPRTSMSRAQECTLIRASGLRYARPEAQACAWVP